MDLTNAQMGEVIAILEKKVGAATSTPLVTTYVDIRASKFKRFMAVLVTLTITDAETMDFAIWKASAADGTGAALLKGATQRAAHATANDAIAIVVSLAAEEMDVDKPFIAARCVTSSTGGGTVGMFLLGMNHETGQIVDLDVASVVEVVN